MTSIRRILGVDPGSRITGIGVIEYQSLAKPNCLFGGNIHLTAKDMPTRLGTLFIEIQAIAQTYRPTELAIEQVFVQKNPASALKLGQARGVAIAAAMAMNLPVFEYSARQVKQAIVGRGGAEKSQVQHMMQILLTLQDKPQADTADALAVALCHLHSTSGAFALGKMPVLASRRKSKRSKAWEKYDRSTTR